MKYRADGSIQSALTPTHDRGRRQDFGFYRCLVTRVVYVDDPNNFTVNSSNARVLYDVVVLGGFAAGQPISNCRLSSWLGGNDSFSERTLRAATSDVSTKKLGDSDGDIVFVQFVQGHTGFPVIVALDNGIKPTTTGAKKSEGPRSVEQFNGVKETINKDGEWTLEVSGGTANSEKGSFKPNASPKTTLSITKDQKFTAKSSTGVSIELDGQNNKVTIQKGATQIIMDGNSDKISLKGGFVDLGSSVNDFAVLFTELLTAFNSHTHPFTDITPGGPVPSVTQAPTAPMLQSVGSQTVKVQP